MCDSTPTQAGKRAENNWGVLYDLAHCVGADFKHAQAIEAILTVNPEMSWDFFLQAFGRIRHPEHKEIQLQILIPQHRQMPRSIEALITPHYSANRGCVNC